MDTCAVVSVLILVLVIGAAVLITLRERGERCLGCGKRLPKGMLRCPSCNPAPLPPMRAGGEAAPEKQLPSKAPVSPFELVATRGPLVQQRFPIPPQGLSIGRRPDNDVVLADELMVSRQHAQIVVEQGEHILCDRDSANGTWVNEQRIFRHNLTSGDRIQIWQSEFAFVPTGAPLPATPESIATPGPQVQVVGEYFDGYYLETTIGRGGMSEVFRGRDPSGQAVAIKILRVSDPYVVNKFVQEGNRIGPLLRGHPNIVDVFGFGQSTDNRLYMVMEYVDAPSLRRVMQRPLAEAEITRLIGQACQALDFAHQRNVVHRDVKPENILVTGDGTVKILDFGIAKLTSAATATSDKIVGTPEYISPEQARGDPPQPASDVYSLGIVLYEILAGSVPFRRPLGEDPRRAAMEVVRLHLKERPEPIRKRNPNATISPQLERTTMRALEKDLQDRFHTAREMGLALGFKQVVNVPAQPVLPRKAYLTVVQGPRQGQRITLSEQSLTLGRPVLGSSDVAVSRQHANIVLRGDTYWLQDISRNGTWVDNQRVYGEVPLRTGALVIIGDSLLRLDKESL